MRYGLVIIGSHKKAVNQVIMSLLRVMIIDLMGGLMSPPACDYLIPLSALFCRHFVSGTGV